MWVARAMLEEFEQEAKTTRRFLEQVPQDKLAWKPHEKSHTAGALGLHIADVPGSMVRAALVDEPPRDFAALFKQPATVQEILSSHDRSVETVNSIERTPGTHPQLTNQHTC